MRNIKLTLEYDGSNFFGFQRQNTKPTIQAALETALSKLLGRPTRIKAAAGRTDSGVHAAGQVINFKTESPLALEKIQQALNAFLPQEIAVKKIEEVSADFHSRFDAKWKTYEYCVFNSRVRSPLVNGRAHLYRYPLNLNPIKKAARLLVGRRDFKAFQSTGSSAKTSVRHIRRLSVLREGPLLRFTVEANGFLYHMVRSIVGTLLDVGRWSLTLKEFQVLVKKGDRKLAGATLPAKGLTLVSVSYTRR